MKGEDLTRLARWVVPGWIAPLSFGLFVFVNDVSEGNWKFLKKLLDMLAQPSATDALVWGILLAASGVPIGFLIYQAYFFVRWNSPLAEGRTGYFVSDRRSELEALIGCISKDKLSLDATWRKKLVKHLLFQCDVRFAWRYVELLFREIIEDFKDPGAEMLLGRYRHLQEIVHILGASLSALYIGFGGYLIFWEHISKYSIVLSHLGFVTFLATIGIAYLLEGEGRERVQARQSALTELCEKEEDSSSHTSSSTLVEIASARPSLYFSFRKQPGLGWLVYFFEQLFASILKVLSWISDRNLVKWLLDRLSKAVVVIADKFEDKFKREEGISDNNGNSNSEEEQQSVCCSNNVDEQHYVTLVFPGLFVVLILFLVHIFLNPRLTPPHAPVILGGFFVSALATGIWLLRPCPHNVPPDLFRGILTQWSMGIGTILLALLWHPKLPIGFLASLTVFLGLQITFFRNRRDAKYDMLMLQHYTLHRYFEKRERKNARSLTHMRKVVKYEH